MFAYDAKKSGRNKIKLDKGGEQEYYLSGPNVGEKNYVRHFDMMSYDEWRRSKEDYLNQPSYQHPEFETPLQEPYKRSNGQVLVKYKGIPIVSRHKKPQE